ncbi:MAG: hypothetical protein JNM63_08480 [Spirochaetia bacterium]|nr:hypothetical protein [Spirochaetia bacterium]
MKALRIGYETEKPLLKARIKLRIDVQVLAGVSAGESPVLSAKVATPGALDADAITVEAENFQGEAGSIEAVAKVAASGKAIKGWDSEGQKISWPFAIRESGLYAVDLRYCLGTERDSRRGLLVDGKAVDGGVSHIFPSTGGFAGDADDWKNVRLASGPSALLVYLDKGTHLISFVNQGGPLNLDWVRLVPVKILREGFEGGLPLWNPGMSMSEISAEAAHTGKRGLRVVDTDEKSGSSFTGLRMEVREGQSCRLSFQARVLNGKGALFAGYLKFYDAAGKVLNGPPKEDKADVDGDREWKEYRLEAKAPKGAVTVEIWFHSFNYGKGTIDVDDVEFEAK